jgi:hypothetical protein
MKQATNSIVFPPIFVFSDCRSYFEAFWIENKTHAFFSSRYLANKLNWSHSYFHDVKSGRKKMTIQKCLEFAFFGKLHHLEVKYLLLLVLKDSDHDLTKQYANTEIKYFNLTELKTNEHG